MKGAVLRGLEATAVDIEVAIGRGSGFSIVGLGRPAVREGRERLRNAIEASGFQWPTNNVTINLAPGDIVKEGTSLDLAIALAILAGTGQIQQKCAEPVFAIGELGLTGRLRTCRGALRVGCMVSRGATLIAPADNRYELGLLVNHRAVKRDFTAFVVSDLREAVAAVEGRSRPTPPSEKLRPVPHQGVDFRDVKGQVRAKRALEVAAAGGHNALLIGPPGEGKSLLAKALPTILPALSYEEVVELTGIYSAKGALPSTDSVVVHRPYRPVHHTASAVAIVGGGSGFPMPGEITLAHRGVLFMDELPEFPPNLLETLRQPLEDGVVNLNRKDGAATYPCQIVLIAAMNPCPCGFEGEFKCEGCDRKLSFLQDICPDCKGTRRKSLCRCLPSQVDAYTRRISGPIMDRIDLVVRVTGLTAEERFDHVGAEDSSGVRKRVEAARDVQKRRFEGTPYLVNARIPGGRVDSYCELSPSAMAAMREVAKRVPALTTRRHDKLLKVARTIADLNHSGIVTKKHIREAADLCGNSEVREFIGSDAETESCSHCAAQLAAGAKYCHQCGTPTGPDAST